MSEDVRKVLVERWATDRFKKLSIGKANRAHASLSTCGSRPATEHARDIASEIEHFPDMTTFFLYAHQRADGTFIDDKASNTDAEIERSRIQISSQPADCTDPSSSPQPLNEDTLYLDVVGVRKKGRNVYGTGSYGLSEPSVQSRAPPPTTSTRVPVGGIERDPAYKAMRKEIDELCTRMERHDDSITAIDQRVTSIDHRVIVVQDDVTAIRRDVQQTANDVRELVMQSRVDEMSLANRII